MPSYVREGSVPHKRHIQFRRPDGGLYAEELFSTKGFESVYSLLYHAHPPTATLDVRPWERRRLPLPKTTPYVTGISRAPRCSSREAIPSRRERRCSAIATWSSPSPTHERPMEYFYRNTGGDELFFIHHGAGVIETQFGELAYRERDYVLLPTGTIYRVYPAVPTRILVYETTGAVTIPRRYRNEFGQLEEHAPYYERDFRAPVLKPAVDTQGEYEIRVTNAGRNAIYLVQNHPCDVIGWDGYCYPYAFNLDEFAPITGKLHQPPPAHATFDAPGRGLLRVRSTAIRLPSVGNTGAVQPFQRRLR